MTERMAAVSRVIERLDELYAIGATRIGRSPEEDAAHALAARWMEEAGLAVETDATGNTFGRRGAGDVWTGSHLDTVPGGGRVDGALGVNVARRDLGERLADVSAVLGEAIRYGLDHREEALAYAEGFGRGIDRETTDRFVAMYVNELTCDYGETGRRAVDELLRRAGTGVTADYA